MHQSDSVPYCNSYECHKDSVVEPRIMPEADETNWHYNERVANNKWKGALHQKDSVPYCTSYECKTGSPAHKADYEFVPNAEFKDRYVHPTSSLHQSIPDCNSYDCRTDSSVEPYVVPEGDNSNWVYNDRIKQNKWKGALLQSKSIPYCTSYECHRDSSVEPWIVPEADESNWEYNERWNGSNLAQSNNLWYDASDDDNDGELWTSNMPENE